MVTHKNISITDDLKLQLITTKQKLFGKKDEEDAFYELCFCICSPQTTFSKNSNLNAELRKRNFFKGFIPYEELQQLTIEVRFHHRKALFLLEANRDWSTIWYNINQDSTTDFTKRAWLVENVRGLGYKTASHFLRNAIGAEYFAILDTHVCKFLECTPPKSSTMYLLQEQRFLEIAEKLKLTPMELDLYIWSYYARQPLDTVR